MSMDFISLVEVKPLPGFNLFTDKIQGAFVRCYVYEDNKISAINRIKIAIAEYLMEVIKIEWCIDYASTEWENPESEEGKEYMQEARVSGEVIFGEFHVW